MSSIQGFFSLGGLLGAAPGGLVIAVAAPGSGGLLQALPVLGYIASHASVMVALGMLSLSGLVIAMSAGIIRRRS